MTNSPNSKSESKKSGLRNLPQGEILFNENDHAESLFIIQKGQIRLFRPKGKGFVEIAVLRSGEVIGEMAFFDEKARKRSCSASAQVETEVIEVSFQAFGKTISNLNPWFKTIINTLADRLRKTNERVKELEANSLSYGKGSKVATYQFFSNVDIVRGFSLLYLTMKTHGEMKEDKLCIHMDMLKFYLFDIFGYSEIKFEELLQLLINQGFGSLENDKDKLPKVVVIDDIERIRGFIQFFNIQRKTEDTKQLAISNKCERFLKRIYNQVLEKGIAGEKINADLSIIINDFKERNVPIDECDLEDAIEAEILSEVVIDKGSKLTSEVDFDKLKDLFPSIVLMNQIKKVNESKGKGN